MKSFELVNHAWDTGKVEDFKKAIKALFDESETVSDQESEVLIDEARGLIEHLEEDLNEEYP